MSIDREITVDLIDQPGTFANLCRGLANRGVHILAVQATPETGHNRVRLIVDGPSAAQKVTANQNMQFTETKVVQAVIANWPGELARVATRLGEARINIDHLYSGLDPKTNQTVMFFGATDVHGAATILGESAATAAGSSR